MTADDPTSVAPAPAKQGDARLNSRRLLEEGWSAGSRVPTLWICPIGGFDFSDPGHQQLLIGVLGGTISYGITGLFLEPIILAAA
jgi:hypothetical protein